MSLTTSSEEERYAPVLYQIGTPARWYNPPAAWPRSGVAEFDTRAVRRAGDSPGVELGDTRAVWAPPQDQLTAADFCIRFNTVRNPLRGSEVLIAQVRAES